VDSRFWKNSGVIHINIFLFEMFPKISQFKSKKLCMWHIFSSNIYSVISNYIYWDINCKSHSSIIAMLLFSKAYSNSARVMRLRWYSKTLTITFIKCVKFSYTHTKIQRDVFFSTTTRRRKELDKLKCVRLDDRNVFNLVDNSDVSMA